MKRKKMIMFVEIFLEMCAEGVKGETIIFIMSSQINFQYGEIRIFPLNCQALLDIIIQWSHPPPTTHHPPPTTHMVKTT